MKSLVEEDGAARWLSAEARVRLRGVHARVHELHAERRLALLNPAALHRVALRNSSCE